MISITATVTISHQYEIGYRRFAVRFFSRDLRICTAVALARLSLRQVSFLVNLDQPLVLNVRKEGRSIHLVPINENFMDLKAKCTYTA